MNHHEILNSDLPIPPSHGVISCRECTRTALRYWPALLVTTPNGSSYNPAEPYCETCLVEAKTRLSIALNAQPPL